MPGDESESRAFFRRVEDAFAEASPLSADAARAFLERLRAEDPAIADEVARMLETSAPGDESAPFSGLLGSARAMHAGPVTIGAGSRLGPYEIVRHLGSGGFGDVYLAEQREPIERRVAVKLARSLQNTEAVLARFERERHALTLMDHPGIARVLDAGLTEGGRPYFVMEYVDGRAIDRYCELHGLGVADRVELLISTARALHHAHQKGVIHRDLKPSNILVTEIDGRPTPKIIDFGIAAPAEPGSLLREGLTAEGLIIGTPEFMSPEQAGGRAIDTRSDLYSLGVLAYTLLAGSPPIRAKTLRHAALHEVLRVIQEVEPPRPSARARELTAESSEDKTAPATRPTVERRSAELRGDLDWIVMRALEKDPDRRYSSVAAFAADLERHRSGLAVEAGPASASYRFRKFASRHRGALAAAGVAVLALLAGSAAATIGFVRATRALELAERRQRVTEAVNAFFNDQVLAAADPYTDPDPDTTIVEALERALENIEGRFGSEPAVEGNIRLSAGRTLTNLGRNEAGEEQLRRALELLESSEDATELDRTRARLRLGRNLGERGAYDESRALLERAVESYERLLGRDAFETQDARGTLVLTMLDQADFEAARPHSELLVSGVDDGTIATDRLAVSALGNAGSLAYKSGDVEGAVPYYERMIELAEEHLGPDHPETSSGIASLALITQRLGDFDRAIPLHERSIEISNRTLGVDHPYTLTSRNNYAMMLSSMGRHEEADERMKEILRIRVETLGETHPDTMVSLAMTARNLGRMGRFDEAERLALRAHELFLEHLGADHPYTAIARGVVARIYEAAGREEDAALWDSDAPITTGADAGG